MPQGDDEIDVLIGTDCISEGQNLQDCDYLVNYDIHWNPVRIIQRFGRIDRIGSTNASIQLVNFWPDISLDEYINLKERVENRMVIADLAATADDNILTRRASDAAFRKEQLRKLQDEVIELEDVRTGVSITDLGLNDFRMDLLGYIKEYGDLAASPKGLHAVVPADPEQGPEARRDLRAAERRRRRRHLNRATGCTRTTSCTSTTRARSSPTTPRSSSCSTSSVRMPQPRTSRSRRSAESSMGPQRRRGHGQYSELLTSAIRSMINVTEERDIDSLFAGAQTTALAQTFAGLDDFELMAFLAIVDPEDGG